MINIKKTNKVCIYCILGFLVFIFYNHCGTETQNRAESPSIKKGFLDLSAWDLKSQGPLRLDGEWEFYWDVLLQPEDFLDKDSLPDPVYVTVPFIWNDSKLANKTFPAFGYATLRLRIKLPQEKQPSLKALSIIDMYTAYALWIDGKIQARNGIVGKNKEQSIPRWQPQLVIFNPQTNITEILVHVSNFHFDKGGLGKTILFGNQDQILALRISFKVINYFIIGAIITMAIYHLLLFLFNRDKTYLFYFGLFCIVFVLRMMVTDERSLLDLFPGLSWDFTLHIEFLTTYFAAIIFLQFLATLFPKEINRVIKLIFIITSFLGAALIIAVPTYHFNFFNNFYLIILFLACIYVNYVLILAAVRKRYGALYLFIGLLLFSVTIVYDIIATIYIINTRFLAPLGLLSFILTEFSIYIKYIKAEKELAEREKQLMQADKLASLGTLVAGVAHEINNPNNSILLTSETLSATWQKTKPILDEYIKEHGDFLMGASSYSEVKEEISDSYNRVIRNAIRIKNIVQELKDFSRKDENNLWQEININTVVESAVLLIKNQIKKYTNNFTVNYGKNIPKTRGQYQKLEQVIINLLQNALQALTEKDSGITVSTEYNEADAKIIVSLADQGAGMDSKTLKHICDPFYTTKRKRGGTGLGLSVSSRIIEEHGGQLEFKSQAGKGTTVSVILNAIEK